MKKCKGELCHRTISKTSIYNYNLFEQDDLIKKSGQTSLPYWGTIQICNRQNKFNKLTDK